MALRDHMRVDDRASIGYLDYPEQERRILAKKSLKWKCPSCTGNDEVESSQLGESKATSVVNNQLTVLTVVLAVLAIVFSYIYYHQ